MENTLADIFATIFAAEIVGFWLFVFIRSVNNNTYNDRFTYSEKKTAD